MPRAIHRRTLSIAATLLVVVGLTGCIGGGDRPVDRIGRATQDTLTQLGLRSGVDTFNNGEGMGSVYKILICAELPDDVEGRAAAKEAAEVVNALRDMTAAEAEFVNAVTVRFVPESARATDDDLNDWCRRQYLDQTVDLTSVAALFSKGSVRGPDYTVGVPYDVVEVLADAP
jgi:hypothetical protein